MIILKTMDICKKYKECHKNIEDLYNFDGWEGDTDGK